MSRASQKRQPNEIARDRRQIAELYLRGKLQTEIAEHLGLSVATISRDLKTIQDEWRRSAIRDFDERKAQELAKIDTLEREYWEAWRESKETKETTINETISADGGDRVKDHVKREGQVGNPLFLQGVERCIEQRLKIFGFYAPTKIAVEDLDALIEKEIDILSGRTDGQQPANELVN